MSPNNQIHISPSSRGIADHFFCFTCDEYVWDCDHLIEERLPTPRFPALDGNKLQSFAYAGRSRATESAVRLDIQRAIGGAIPLLLHSAARLFAVEQSRGRFHPY